MDQRDTKALLIVNFKGAFAFVSDSFGSAVMRVEMMRIFKWKWTVLRWCVIRVSYERNSVALCSQL